MTDFGTILGEVFAGIFGPWLCYVVAVLVILIGFLGALALSDPDGDMPWQLITAAWITWVVIVIVAVSFMIFLGQFDAWTWVVKPELLR
ncbi:hypothetical protein SEA_PAULODIABOLI_268 [Microbacterium phage PauloDiaboli]|nr:hypothetical protein SEA_PAULODIABOLI_268 [Microbacterium phage PauloDiaboli]QWY84075.1 hypothetical protein SEA_A3WALLY_268 [Microbacterium phage A3Wally]